ncbi:MAG TPA: hypothetical protein VGD78_18800 [Chthoniobacterales bacterium]
MGETDRLPIRTVAFTETATRRQASAPGVFWTIPRTVEAGDDEEARTLALEILRRAQGSTGPAEP